MSLSLQTNSKLSFVIRCQRPPPSVALLCTFRTEASTSPVLGSRISMKPSVPASTPPVGCQRKPMSATRRAISEIPLVPMMSLSVIFFVAYDASSGDRRSLTGRSEQLKAPDLHDDEAIGWTARPHHWSGDEVAPRNRRDCARTASLSLFGGTATLRLSQPVRVSCWSIQAFASAGSTSRVRAISFERSWRAFTKSSLSPGESRDLVPFADSAHSRRALTDDLCELDGIATVSFACESLRRLSQRSLLTA